MVSYGTKVRRKEFYGTANKMLIGV